MVFQRIICSVWSNQDHHCGYELIIFWGHQKCIFRVYVDTSARSDMRKS